MFKNQIEQAKSTLEEKFRNHIPESLYWNYQELSQFLGGSPRHWEALLDDPEFKQFIEIQLSKYLEIDARKAINRLANDPSLSSSDITALTRVIENSKLLQQKYDQKQDIIITYLPDPNPNNPKEGEKYVRTESSVPTTDV